MSFSEKQDDGFSDAETPPRNFQVMNLIKQRVRLEKGRGGNPFAFQPQLGEGDQQTVKVQTKGSGNGRCTDIVYTVGDPEQCCHSEKKKNAIKTNLSF